MIIDIFNASDDAQRILDSVLSDGVTGIHGRRLDVRAKLDKVAELAESAGYESIMAHSTIDHPDTELAYPYDKTRFDSLKAREEVTKSYDFKHF